MESSPSFCLNSNSDQHHTATAPFAGVYDQCCIRTLVLRLLLRLSRRLSSPPSSSSHLPYHLWGLLFPSITSMVACMAHPGSFEKSSSLSDSSHCMLSILLTNSEALGISLLCFQHQLHYFVILFVQIIKKCQRANLQESIQQSLILKPR